MATKKLSEILIGKREERENGAASDNTRVSVRRPMATPDLDDEGKKDVIAQSEWDKTGESTGGENRYHTLGGFGAREITENNYSEYTNPDTGEKRKVKEGETVTRSQISKNNVGKKVANGHPRRKNRIELHYDENGFPVGKSANGMTNWKKLLVSGEEDKSEE